MLPQAIVNAVNVKATPLRHCGSRKIGQPTTCSLPIAVVHKERTELSEPRKSEA